MRVALDARPQIEAQPGGTTLVQSLLKSFASLMAGYHRQHTVDDAHGDITATSIVTSGTATFTGNPRCRIYKNDAGSGQNISDSTDTFVTWDRPKVGSPADEYDQGVMFDGTDTITCTGAGLYVAQAMVRWDANSTGSRTLRLYLTYPLYGVVAEAVCLGDGTNGPTQQISAVIAVSDQYPTGVKVQVFQTSGATRTVGAGSGVSDWFAVAKIG